MMKRSLIELAIAGGLVFSTGFVIAADKIQTYGSELMTQQERLEHRAKLGAAKTAEERERIRNEHHQLMKKRADTQGKTLPDKPPASGSGRGPAGGRGR